MTRPTTVRVVRRGPASWAQIEAPRGNACGPAELDALADWLASAPAENGVRALVLTGTADAFCSGADVAAAASMLGDEQAVLAFVRRGRELAAALAAAAVPTVAAVNGVAFAGGLELVLACDFAIASSTATFGDRHVRYGIVPGWGASARLPRAIGTRAATLLLTTGRDISAGELERLGGLTAVVEPERLEAAVDELVEELARVPASAQRRALALARASMARPLDEALDAEWEALREQLADPELHAGVRRFLGA
mgnify:CR=1 FL=1